MNIIQRKSKDSHCCRKNLYYSTESNADFFIVNQLIKIINSIFLTLLEEQSKAMFILQLRVLTNDLRSHSQCCCELFTTLSLYQVYIRLLQHSFRKDLLCCLNLISYTFELYIFIKLEKYITGQYVNLEKHIFKN